jgi:pilus assembly protein CpaB
MNRNRLLMIGMLALLLAAVVSFAVYRVLRLTLASTRSSTTAVVVAATDLAVGARLEEKDLRLAKFPDGVLPEGVFHSTSELVGRGVLLPVSSNELLLSGKLTPENAGAGLPSLIATGMRAVSVRVNEVVSVAGFVGPGTHVDVLLTGNPSRNHEPARLTTTTVLENVQVLAAGHKLQRNAQGEPQNVPVITLLVSPEDAQKLTLAAAEGRIQLTLRNPMDHTHSNVPALNQVALYNEEPGPQPLKKQMAKKASPQPVAAPFPAYIVELIRGDKREEKSFK